MMPAYNGSATASGLGNWPMQRRSALHTVLENRERLYYKLAVGCVKYAEFGNFSDVGTPTRTNPYYRAQGERTRPKLTGMRVRPRPMPGNVNSYGAKLDSTYSRLERDYGRILKLSESNYTTRGRITN
jgi:hypothetical protein